jgi:apolipoprotein N-acyltransferase
MTEPTQPHIARWVPWAIAPAGALLGLSFPNELLPGPWRDHPPALLAWLALIPLLWAVLALPARQARLAAWGYGLCAALVTVSWLRLFTVLPWVLVAAYLSLLPWLAVGLAHTMRLPRWLTPLGVALAWAGGEWLRGQGVFGFAWGEVGATQVDGITGSLAAVGGLPLASLLMLWSVGSVVAVVTDRTAPRWAAFPAVAVLAAALVAGCLTVRGAEARWQASPTSQRVSVVQPNTLRGLTPEALVTYLSPEELDQRLRTTLDCSRRAVPPSAAEDSGNLVIWPESALTDSPFAMDNYSSIAGFLGATRSHLLCGAPSTLVRDGKAHVQNAAYLLAPFGAMVGQYHKVHLVPFGEFVPLRRVVVDWLHFTVRERDILPGAGHQPLALGPHRLGVGICFESTFPEIARAYANRGAGLLIFITNDAWFHQTSAVRQHFNHARFRAIETGLPVARAANTGISGFIAPDGRILDEIPVYTGGARARVLHAGVPGTPCARGGWLVGPVALLLALLLAAVGVVRGWRAAPTRDVHTRDTVDDESLHARG